MWCLLCILNQNCNLLRLWLCICLCLLFHTAICLNIHLLLSDLVTLLRFILLLYLLSNPLFLSKPAQICLLWFTFSNPIRLLLPNLIRCSYFAFIWYDLIQSNPIWYNMITYFWPSHSAIFLSYILWWLYSNLKKSTCQLVPDLISPLCSLEGLNFLKTTQHYSPYHIILACSLTYRLAKILK